MGLYSRFNGGSAGNSEFSEQIMERTPYLKETGREVSPNSQIPIPVLTGKNIFPFPASTAPHWALDGYVYQIDSVGPSFSRVSVETGDRENLPSLEGIPTSDTLGNNIIYGKKLVFVPNDSTTSMTNNKIYLFNTETLTWEDPIVLPTTRCNNSVAIHEDRLYFFGGYFTNKTTESKSTEYYDFSTGQYVAGLALLPAAKQNGIGFSYNGKIYLVGGSTTAVYEYSPSANTFVAKTAMPVTKSSIFSGGIVNGRIVLMGSTSDLSALAYNIASNSWTNLFTSTGGRFVFIKALPNGNAYFWSVVASVNLENASVYSYEVDPTVTNKFTPKLEYGIGYSSSLFATTNPNNWMRKHGNKIYHHTATTANNYSPIDSRYLFEVDLETGNLEKYAIPENNGFGSSLAVISRGKVLIFPHSRVMTVSTPATTVTNRDAVYSFDIETKTFEKISADPSVLSGVNDTGVSNRFFVSGDVMVYWFYSSNYWYLRGFNFSTMTKTDYFGQISSTGQFYTEGETLYAAIYSSQLGFELYTISLVDGTFTKIKMNTGSVSPIASGWPFVVKDNLVFFFFAPGYIDLYDIEQNTYSSKKAFYGSERQPEVVVGSEGVVLHIGGKEVVPDVLREIYTAKDFSTMKLMRGEVIVVDGDGDFVGSIAAANSIAEIPLAPGFVIKHLTGNKIVAVL
jgi:hypothetical protein